MANNSPFKPKIQIIEPSKLPPLPVIGPKGIEPSNAPTNSMNTQEQTQTAETPKISAGPTINDLENQIAQAQVESSYKKALSPEEEELKKQTIQNILSSMQTPIPTPRYLTIQDFFNKNADLSGVVGSFNPGVARGLNSIFGTKVFGDNGKIIDLAEEHPRRLEAQMQAEQAKAFELQKQQKALTNDVFRSMNEVDAELMKDAREAQRFEQLTNQFNKNYDFREKQFEAQQEANRLEREDRLRREEENRQANQQALQRQIEQQQFNNDLNEKKYQLEKDKLDFQKEKEGLNGGAGSMNATTKKALAENNTTLKNIEAGLKAIEENPLAYRAGHAILSPKLLNTYASYTGKDKDIETRATIDNITAVYRKWLTGAQMSDRERLDYERFLPAKGDNDKIVKAKLKAMKESIERNNQSLLNSSGLTAQPDVDSDPMSLGL